MHKKVLNEELLDQHVKRVDQILLDSLPKERELDHEFSPLFEKKMQSLLQKEKTTRLKALFGVGKRKIVLVTLLLLMIMTITFSVEAFRVRVFRVFTNSHRDHSSITYTPEGYVPTSQTSLKSPEYIPGGYKVVREFIAKDLVQIVYRNNLDSEIIYKQQSLEDEEGPETEGEKTETIVLHDQEVRYFSRDAKNHVFWKDHNSSYVFISDVDVEELLEMAKSVIKQK